MLQVLSESGVKAWLVLEKSRTVPGNQKLELHVQYRAVGCMQEPKAVPFATSAHHTGQKAQPRPSARFVQGRRSSPWPIVEIAVRDSRESAVWSAHPLLGDCCFAKRYEWYDPIVTSDVVSGDIITWPSSWSWVAIDHRVRSPACVMDNMDCCLRRFFYSPEVEVEFARGVSIH